MNSIALCLLLVIPVTFSQGPGQAPGQAPGGQPQDLLSAYCPDGNANCQAAVKRCLGEPPQTEAPPNANEITSKYNNCFKSHGIQEVATASQDQDPSILLQTRLQSIKDASVISSLRCCFGRELGVLDANNKINLKNYNTDIQQNYKNDREARTVFENAIKFCPAEATDCEPGMFNECTFQYCISSLLRQN